MADSEPLQSMSVNRAPRRRAWLFRALLLLIGWAAIECCSLVIFQLISEHGIEEVQQAQLTLSQKTLRMPSYSESFHPYFGWTHNPDIHTGDIDCCGLPLRANRFGFFDSTDGIHLRSPDRLIVGICGGSVAWHMSCAAENLVKQRLTEIPQYRDREVILVRLAQPGYKQPQGLFALSYFLFMGAEFDLILNLDGYNEIALPAAENFASMTALDYPQGWNVRSLDIVDPRDADFSLRVFELRGARQRAAESARTSLFRFLPSYQLWWFTRNENLRIAQLELQEELQKRRRTRKGMFAQNGPHPMAKTNEEATQECIRIWKQSSLHLHMLCQAHGIAYFHATQPNQYDVDSKLLSEYEQEHCYSDSVTYREHVIRGYPQLRQAGEELRQAGVRQFDLTRIFETVEETLYIDPYCHFNTRGSELLAEAFVTRVKEALSRNE